MRHSRVISFIFLANCLGTLQGVLGKNDKATSKRGEAQVFSRSGQFTTKHKHVCTWEIDGDAVVSLSLSCNEPSSINYNCTYKGEPLLCPLYTTKAKQYWKPILGKFRKMNNACEDKTLKSRLCKKAEAVASELRKIGADGLVDTKKGKTKGKARVKEPAKGTQGGIDISEAIDNIDAEKKANPKRKKPDLKLDQDPNPSAPPSNLTAAIEVNDDIVELNENLAETYCSENWHSLCSFFVNFWNG
ncbi:fibroblast growth factor-binding protein 3 [Gastrophryne carolinensis]